MAGVSSKLLDLLGCLANSFLLNFTEGNLFVLLSGILMYSGGVEAARKIDVPA
jgi:hypothetical protein